MFLPSFKLNPVAPGNPQALQKAARRGAQGPACRLCDLARERRRCRSLLWRRRLPSKSISDRASSSSTSLLICFNAAEPAGRATHSSHGDPSPAGPAARIRAEAVLSHLSRHSVTPTQGQPTARFTRSRAITPTSRPSARQDPHGSSSSSSRVT